MRDKTVICESFLKHLADGRERGGVVEALRNAASLLDGTSPLFFGVGCDVNAAIDCERAKHKAARALRDLAASLCDHGRTHGAHCRYCESVLPFADYGTNILAREIDDE
jgi:hypothetical protein